MTDISKLKEQVFEENVRLHAMEASIYEAIHPQVFNWYHTRKIWNDISFIKSALGDGASERILDLGCGTGFITLKLASHFGAHVTGVDISREMLQELEKKIALMPEKRLDLVHMEATKYLKESAAKEYDLIAASAFLHHLVDLQEFFDLALGRLRKGGILYIAYEPLKQPITSKIRFALHRVIRFLDAALFDLRMKSLNIDLKHDHEKSLADYQTTLGGVAPEEIIKNLDGKGEILRLDKFAVRGNGFLAFLADKVVKSQNTVSVIFKKS